MAFFFKNKQFSKSGKLIDSDENISPDKMQNYIKGYDDLMCKIVHINNINKYIYSFSIGYVKISEKDGKVVYIWQDAKGNISYSFDLSENKAHTTSIAKLSNVYSSHFQDTIEVENNINDTFKKRSQVTIGLNKSITDLEKHDSFVSYSNTFNQPNQLSNSNNQISMNDMVSMLLDSPENKSKENNIVVSNDTATLQNQPLENQNHSKFNQKELHQQTIELFDFQHQYREQVSSIYANELPVVVKEDFKPETKQFFYKDNGLICKNSYIASKYMTNLVLQPDTINSFTLSFILYMAKGDTTQALNIIVWLAYSFNYLEKLPFTLVLHSDCDKYMKLFYEEIIEPFFNPDHCEEINSDDLTKKALSIKLDKKVIYHFKDIVEATIFKAPANELIKRVQYKDTYKLNNKTTITKANILITSTSNYIPLIAKDVKSIVVNVESDLKSFCKAKNITTDPYYTVADLIKHDLPNFSFIIRSMDMDKLYGLFHHNYYDGKNADIMDNNVDILEVFEASFRYQDKPFFKITEKKSPKLYQQLMDDLNMNRVNRHKLLDYFSLLFGENIYKNNTALIAALKKISSTDQPFENDKPFQIGKNVYYKL